MPRKSKFTDAEIIRAVGELKAGVAQETNQALAEQEGRNGREPLATGKAMTWDWVPGVRCDRFVLGSPFADYAELELLKLDPSHEGDEQEGYSYLEHAVHLYFEGGILVFFECWRSVIFGHTELIGTTPESLSNLL